MFNRAAAVPLVGGLLVALAQGPPGAWGAPCIQACKPEIAACVGAECQGLATKRARRHCKRRCARTIVNDCYRDLSVCGATVARPVRPGPAPGPGPGQPSQPPSGGW